MKTLKSGMFSTQTVADFPFPNREIVEVNDTDTIDSAFRLLVQNKILSAPVWSEEKNSYLGFFDITDALALIYSVDLLISAIPDAMLKDSVVKQLASGNSGCPDCKELTVATVFEGSEDDNTRESKWHPVKLDTPMSEVILLLATSTRRVPVLGEDGRVKKIISQSHITHVLNEVLKEKEAAGKPIPDIFSKTPNSSGGFGLRDVLKVNSETNTARDAFRMVIENGVSSVAVVDEDGGLLSSITTKDIRLFNSMEEAAMQRLQSERSKREDGKESLALMDLNCGDFVSMVELTRTNTGMTMAPAVVVQADTPIRKMVSRLALTKKHRLFIADENKRPIGVIAVSDIAKLLVTDPSS